jgi:hypothetical protein
VSCGNSEACDADRRWRGGDAGHRRRRFRSGADDRAGRDPDGGPSQPRDFTPGGIGPGGGAVAPGRAARDVNIERIGPGGTRLAPGPAGNVGTGAAARPPAASPSSSGLRTTVKSKRRLHRGKTKRRPQAGW